MLANATGVIMTTMKLKIQLEDVARAFAGARIFSGTISAGYSQVIPSQPIAKKVLKTKRKTIQAMLAESVPALAVPARMAMEMDIPAAPKSMRVRRPKRSMVKTATHEAMKYSVPLQAAMRRDFSRDKFSWFSSTTGM